MPFKQILADRIIQRYLQGYETRMRVLRPHWDANIRSSDPTKRRDGLVLLHEAHTACHERAFSSMRLKPTDWDAELSTVSLALTLGQAKVSLPDVEFALLERDTANIEELSKRFLGMVAAGFTDAPDQQYSRQKELTLTERAFTWNHAQFRNVGGVIRKIHEISPRVERLAEHEGVSGIIARLGTASGQMDATYAHLTEWVNAHIDDQPK